MTCAVYGCDKPVKARGWCCAHLRRVERYGRPDHYPQRGRPVKHVGCREPGCDRPHAARGLCRRHYQVRLRAGEFLS